MFWTKTVLNQSLPSSLRNAHLLSFCKLVDNAIIYDFITAAEFTQKLCPSQKSQWIQPLNGYNFEAVICAMDSYDQGLLYDYDDYQCEQEFINVQVPEGATVKIPSRCSAWIEDIDVNNKL